MISAGQVLLGPARERVRDGGVLIDGDVITAVGSRAELESRLRPGAIRVDRPEGTILPGLINAHVHLAFAPGTDHEHRLRTIGDGDLSVSMARHTRELLDGGVTTARDLGDRGRLSLTLRDAIAAGDVVGPRLLAAGTPLTPPGGHCWFLGGEVDRDMAGRGSALRERVRELVAAGVDVIKVMGSGGQITASGASMWERQFDSGELCEVVDEANRAGLPVAVHAHGTDSIADAVAAGVGTVEHCSWMSGAGESDFRTEVAAAMATAGVVACSGSTGNAQALADRVGPERIAELFGRLRWMADHGVGVILGSDAGLSRFDDYGVVLRNWSDWGFDAEEVIDMATVDAAQALGLGAVTGRLRPGFAADLVLVDGDPLTDLGALTRVDAVLAQGRLHQPPPAVHAGTAS